MKKSLRIVLVVLVLGTFSACDFLNVVPDNVATLDEAFETRRSAERFLFTCYSYLPDYGWLGSNPAFLASDELLVAPKYSFPSSHIARGDQKVVDPYMNFWEGRNGAKDLYEAIRMTNILLDNIDRVPKLPEQVKRRWIAEAKFLKAYYHFYLFECTGPSCW